MLTEYVHGQLAISYLKMKHPNVEFAHLQKVEARLEQQCSSHAIQAIFKPPTFTIN
jgi:hypothetical protein